MDEFWVCQHCRSLNRAGTGRCYHCRQKFGSKPKEPPQTLRKPGAPPPPSFPPGAIGNPGPASFGVPIGSGAAAAGGAAGAAGAADELPAYLSRPAALTPVRDFSGPGALVTPGPERRGLSLTGPFRRRIAASLVAHQFVSVWFVGYVAAGLLTILLLDGALIVTTLLPVGSVALQTGSITSAWAQVDTSHIALVETMAGAFLVFGLLATFFFSLLVGLSTHNAQSLGVGALLLTPAHAGTCWAAVLRTQVRIAVAFLVPAALFWLGYPLPGLIAALVAVELAQRSVDNPLEWLTDPARHLPDLYAGLGVSGSSTSLVGTVWSICFRAANVLAILAYSIPILAFLIAALATASGRTALLSWPASGTGPYQLAIALVVGLLILTMAVTIGLLVFVSIELVDRQRTRRTLARVGRSRPWIGRPGDYSAPTPGLGSTRWDPYPKSSEPEPDQASLYSPSTTSSFPWGDADSSEDSPLD